jgi:hypothetical protein
VARYSLTTASFREARALELALAGRDWTSIAQELGFSDRSGAYKAAHRGLRRRTAAAADRYLAVLLDDLAFVEAQVMPVAMDGSVRAAEAVLRVIEDRGRLLGLTEAPIKSSPISEGTPRESDAFAVATTPTRGRRTSSTNAEVPSWDVGAFPSF